VIGINKYKSTNVPTLKGAVSDAYSIQQYLENELNVPKSQIRNLYDAGATRAAIISAFRQLQSDPRIKPGDPILIYFAGHGGESTSPTSLHTNSKTAFLVPHDYSTSIDHCPVHGIPYSTIGLLINRIAKTQGNNIVRPSFITDSVL